MGCQFHHVLKPQLQFHVPPPPHDLALKWTEQTPLGSCLLPPELLKTWPALSTLPALPACLFGESAGPSPGCLSWTLGAIMGGPQARGL